MDDEKLDEWRKELNDAVERNDAARVLELMGWITARKAELND